MGKRSGEAAASATTRAEWRNRIIGSGEESPDQLLANPHNFRRHPNFQLEALGGILEEVGWVQQVVVNKRSGFLVDGHARVELALRNGAEKVPVIYVDLNENEERLVLATLDPISALAVTDRPQLSALLDGMQTTKDGVRALLDRLGAKARRDSDQATPPPANPVSRIGDVWRCGRHTVTCGDSTDPTVVGRVVPRGGADLCFTSPPYNVGISYDQHNDEMQASDYERFMRAAVQAVRANLAPGRMLAWNVGVSPRSRPHHHAIWLEESGFTFFRQIVWRKTGAQIPLWRLSREKPKARNYQPNYSHELIYLVANGSDLLYAPTWDHGTLLLASGEELEHGGKTKMPEQLSSDVWDVCQFTAGLGHDHPAAFPVALVELALDAFTADGECVLDVFGGSGSTLIAAHNRGRTAGIVELDCGYVDVTVERWQEHTGEKAVLDGGKETFAGVAAKRGKPKRKAAV